MASTLRLTRRGAANAVLALALVGCSFRGGSPLAIDAAGDDGGGGDGSAVDAMVTPIDGCSTFSDQLDTCELGATEDLTVTGDRVYNTDSHVLADPGGGNAVTVKHVSIIKAGVTMDAIVANRFELAAGARLRLVGHDAFAIVASGALIIAGTLEAVGSMPEAAGARGRGDCAGSAGTNAGNDNGGAPGGGGGGFGAAGGGGGQGDANGGATNGGPGGALQTVPVGLPRGGCPGGDGGNAGGNTRGAAGHGGGAIDLISAVSIDISGAVNAGGSGGGGGKAIDGGGGGGGSGGMIILEAPSVGGTGGVAANGGGGGGGGGNDQSGVGDPGQVSTAVTSGGSPADSGSPGGTGGSVTLAGGQTVVVTDNAGGGGGGGGGVGYIRILRDATPTIAVVSPAPGS